MELPAKQTRIADSDSLLTAAERGLGRLAMVAALGLVVQELQTGESMPDQIMGAAQYLFVTMGGSVQ